MTKLFYYWDMTSNPAAWARNPADYRKQRDCLPGAMVVRVAHVGVAPPPGYSKGDGELACDAVTKGVAHPKTTAKPNIYGIGMAILATSITGIND